MAMKPVYIVRGPNGYGGNEYTSETDALAACDKAARNSPQATYIIFKSIKTVSMVPVTDPIVTILKD